MHCGRDACVCACVADGVFGRCHPAPVKEVYTYDVSPSVVQRFRTLLEKLSNRGTRTRTHARTHACSCPAKPTMTSTSALHGELSGGCEVL